MALIAGSRSESVAGVTLERPVSVGVRESIWLGTDADGSACTVEFHERFDDGAESGEALGAFFERGRLQKLIADLGPASGEPKAGLGGGHVVGVRRLEATAFGGVLVRDRYGVSAAELIAGKVRLRGDALHEIVAGVIGAMLVFGSRAGRAHGAIGPQTVLISDDAIGARRVGLRTPAVAADLGDDPARDDLRALGGLIFSLVVHRPFRAMGGYPVRDGPEWRALGDTSGFWLELVNQLLDPAGPRETLEGVAARVGSLRFRVDGPGVGVWIKRAGIAAGVLGGVGAAAWFLFRPGIEPPRADFKNEEFDRWLRITPLVASLRDEVGAGSPRVLRDAVGRLAVDETAQRSLGVSDLFDIPAVFEQAGLYKGFERSFDDPIPTLREQVLEYAQADFEARAISQKETEDQRRLEMLAGLFREGLGRYGGADVGSDQNSAVGLLGVFTPEAWPARGVIESVVQDGEGAGELSWLHSSSAALFRSRLDSIETGLDAFAAGIADDEALGGSSAQSPGSEASSAVVGEFITAVGAIDEAAGVVGVWRDEVYPGIREGSAKVEASAAWPEVAGVDAARIAGEGDPFLRSFAGVPEAVGAVAPGEGEGDLGRRLRETREMVDAVATLVGEGLEPSRVDLIRHAAWVDSARAALEASPAGDDGASLAAWIDTRVGLGEEWLAAIAQHGVLDPSAWPAGGLSIELDQARELWSEAIAAQKEASLEAERDYLGGNGVIDRRLGELDRRERALRELPRWESLLAEADAETRAIEREFEELFEVTERINAEVLTPPRELIAQWRSTPVEGDGVVGALVEARSALGASFISEWETSVGGAGLDDEALKRAPESAVLRQRLNGLDDVVARAGDRVAALGSADRGYGGFDADAVRERVTGWLAGEFAARLNAFEGWEDRATYREGGPADRLMSEATDEYAARLAELDRDLGELGRARDGIARGFGVGSEEVGGDRAALSETVASFRGEAAGQGAEVIGTVVVGIPQIDSALGAVDALLGIESIDEAGRLLDAFVAESSAEGRTGIGLAALRRLDALAADGTAWPASLDGMLDDRVALAEGLAEARAATGEQDWETHGATLRPIVQAWWLRGVAMASDRSSFERAVRGASGWFDGLEDAPWRGLLDESLLEGRSRYNAGVIRLRDEIDRVAQQAAANASDADRSEIPGIESALLGAVGASLDEIEGLASQTLGDAERSEALAWVRSVRTELDSARAGRRGWDADSFGPVGLDIDGWSVDLDEDTDPPRVIYSTGPDYHSGALSIEFRLISDLESGGQVFLATDEVSVELCGAMLRERGAAIEGNLISDLYEMVGEDRQGNLAEGPSSRELFTRGPRTGANRFRMRSRQKWLVGSVYGSTDDDAYPAYPPGLVGDTPDAISASQGEPTDRHPVNYLGPEVALEIARSFGFRLPTREEYDAAFRLVPQATSGRWNLRDETFVRQHENFQQAAAAGVSHYEPGKWSYDRTAGANPVAWGVNGSDDRLWFYETGPGAEGGFQDGIMFRHLIGNVAEYALTRDDTRRPEGMWALGASALSDPDVQPNDARPAAGAGASTNGFVDVGFRLAIDADDFGSLGKMVHTQLLATADKFFVRSPAGGGGR